MGLDFFLSIFALPFVLVPLIAVLAIDALMPFIPFVPLLSGCMSREGEIEGLESDGVSMVTLVVLEPDLECGFVLVFKGVPPKDFLVSELVISQLGRPPLYVECWRGGIIAMHESRRKRVID